MGITEVKAVEAVWFVRVVDLFFERNFGTALLMREFALRTDLV